MTEQGSPRIGTHALLNSILNISDLAIFWKDRQRKFSGANQKFLDFYGFSSVEDIIGKTDEDMGWHVDPQPFMTGEYEVINEGKEIRGAYGNCIAHGMIRDIITTKKPIYDGGRIIGLIGYFEDVTETNAPKLHRQIDSYRDSKTGLLNRAGLASMVDRYMDGFKRRNIDSLMVHVRIEGLQDMIEANGPEFEDNLMHIVGKRLNRFFGSSAVIGCIENNDIIIIQQYHIDTEIKIIEHNINRALERIYSVKDTPVTIVPRMAHLLASDLTTETPKEALQITMNLLDEGEYDEL